MREYDVRESLNTGLTCQPPMDRNMDGHILPRALKQYMDRRMSSCLEHLGIQGAQAPYLMAVSRNPGATLKDIATDMMVDKAIITRTVGMLTEAGLVVNESDQPRQYSLSLTEEGTRAAEQIRRSFREIRDELLSDLTDEELKAFKSACAKIGIRLNREFGESTGARK